MDTIQQTLTDDASHTHSIDPSKMFWLGDFNHHHPLGDEEQNAHLFTTNNLDAAQTLLDLLADHNMIMALPKDIPTLRAT